MCCGEYVQCYRSWEVISVCAVGSVCCGECVQCYRSWEVFSVCAVGSSVCVLWGVCAVLP